jgi:polyhydroxybutyrate depolymerase
MCHRIAAKVLVLVIALFALVVEASPSDAAATLTLSPGSTVLGVGGLDRFLPVYDPDGSQSALPQFLDGSQVQWSSSNPTVLYVDRTGLVFARKAGTATITALYAGFVAKASVTVAGTVVSRSFVTPDGLTRSYSLYVPDGYSPDTATPLVLAFHGGSGGFGLNFAHGNQLNPVARAKTFIVAYPNGTGIPMSWNGGGCCGAAAVNDVDDVTFTRMLIDDISARYSIDPKRVYATGMSNGGVLVHRLGVQLSDRIAAIASVAGELYPGGDFILAPPARPMSVLVFHGTTDLAYPYNPSTMQNVLGWWMMANAIPLTTPAVTYQRGIETCYTNATSTAEVTLCLANPPGAIIVGGVVYDGGGHAWPGGVKGTYNGPGYDIPTTDINASAAMWDFFARHPMP